MSKVRTFRRAANLSVPLIVRANVLPAPIACAAFTTVVQARDLKITGDGADEVITVSCVN